MTVLQELGLAYDGIDQEAALNPGGTRTWLEE
jgi:hypothetical protein